MHCKSLIYGCVTILACSLTAPTVALGAPSYYGPTPYTGIDDVPRGFYDVGFATVLEDFEDNVTGSVVDFGISEQLSPGSASQISIGGIFVDSVAPGERSYFVQGPNSPMSVTFAFPGPVTAAGIVWTDTSGPTSNQTVTFEAFGPGMVPLGTPVMATGMGDGSTLSNDQDDRFFGVNDRDGIIAIRVTQPGGSAMELDHLQLGEMPDVTGCNLDGDSDCDLTDLNDILAIGDLTAGVPVTPQNQVFDLNGDGTIDGDDLDSWLTAAGAVLGFNSPLRRGDANLDGVVNGQDFLAWNANKFMDVALWNSGDFNGDGVVNGQDFLLWNTNKFASADAGTAAVPEPEITALLLLAIGFGVCRHRS